MGLMLPIGNLGVTAQQNSPPLDGCLLTAIRAVGASSGLKICLDAGDMNSYSGSGQSWLDVSGNGFDFFRGGSAASAGDDPTFNGVAGARSSSEYWSLDGTDNFTYDSANEAFMQTWHKAGAKFSFATHFYFPGTGLGTASLFGDSGGSNANVGMDIQLNSGGGAFLFVRGGGSNVATRGIGAYSAVGWYFLCAAFDEAANSINFSINGAASSGSTSYVSPSAAAATFTMQIGARGNAANVMKNGYRIGDIAIWDGVALSPIQQAGLFNVTRSKWGL